MRVIGLFFFFCVLSTPIPIILIFYRILVYEEKLYLKWWNINKMAYDKQIKCQVFFMYDCKNGLTDQFLLILAHWSKMNRKLILKSHRFILIGAYLTKPDSKPDISGFHNWPCPSVQQTAVVHNLRAWPSGKLPFECQKITKNVTFKKNCQKLSFFQ